MALRSDFKDSVLKDTTGNKKYKMITNSDNTVSFVDVTEYSQEGSNYGAKEVNEEREAINSVIVPKTKAVGSGCYITEVGAVTWFRVVLKMRTKVPEGREYLLGIVPAPMFEVSRKIYIDNSFGFIFDIVSNGRATITPFGGDITAGTEIYVSEFFIKAQE